MYNNDELKEITIKNRTCCHFDDIITFEGFDLDNILIDEKSYETVLVYNISYRTLIGAKSLLISLIKIHEFIRVYDGTRYLVLFGAEKYDFIYNRVRYLIGVKCDITYVVSHDYIEIKVDSFENSFHSFTSRENIDFA